MESTNGLTPEERHELRMQDIRSRKERSGLPDDVIAIIDEVIMKSELERCSREMLLKRWPHPHG